MIMEGGRPINETPVSIRPIQVRDRGHITQTVMADLFCSNCGSHIAWKIISVLSQDASNHQRILFSFFFSRHFLGCNRPGIDPAFSFNFLFPWFFRSFFLSCKLFF